MSSLRAIVEQRRISYTSYLREIIHCLCEYVCTSDFGHCLYLFIIYLIYSKYIWRIAIASSRSLFINPLQFHYKLLVKTKRIFHRVVVSQHPTVILFILVTSPYASSLIFITGDHSNRLQFVRSCVATSVISANVPFTTGSWNYTPSDKKLAQEAQEEFMHIRWHNGSSKD